MLNKNISFYCEEHNYKNLVALAKKKEWSFALKNYMTTSIFRYQFLMPLPPKSGTSWQTSGMLILLFQISHFSISVDI
jgi:hypothetical protein